MDMWRVNVDMKVGFHSNQSSAVGCSMITVHSQAQWPQCDNSEATESLLDFFFYSELNCHVLY